MARRRAAFEMEMLVLTLESAGVTCGAGMGDHLPLPHHLTDLYAADVVEMGIEGIDHSVAAAVLDGDVESVGGVSLLDSVYHAVAH